MAEENGQSLFERAMAAFDIGQRAEAVELLKQAVEEDPENLDAWVQLSKLLEDQDEKRIALSTILRFDPDNEYAQKALAETEREKSEIEDAEEIVPGITRREARFIGIALTVFTILVLGLVIAVVISANTQRGNRRAELTRIANNVTATRFAIETSDANALQEQTQVAFFATRTAIATITPTITPTRTPDLPPTLTPTITPTDVVLRVLPAPPDTLLGSLVVWGGENPQSDDFLNMFRYRWQGGEIISNDRLNADLVQNPTIDDASTRLIYMRLLQGGWVLHQVNGQAPNQGALDLGIQQGQLGARDLRDPDVNNNGNFLVFTAISTQSNTEEIFVTNLLAGSTTQVTNDAFNYRYAAVSPDGTLVAAIQNPETNPDLVLIQANNQQEDGTFPIVPVTSDGINTVESSPDFSPDGQQIIFSLYTTNPQDNDIYAVRLTGGTQPTPPVPLLTSANNELTPIYAPRGNHIAYTSDTVAPGESMQVFVFDFETGTNYQVTEGDVSFFLGGWTN
jgi:hypothetical protein